MKLILKGILLYSTIISTILYICCIDSLVNNIWFFIIFTIIEIILLFLCNFYIDENNIYKITFNKKEDTNNEA